MPDVLLEKTGTFATITLNRPESLNAFSDRQVPEILAALHEVESDPAMGAVVLTGAGRGFSAGGDLAALGTVLQSADPVRISKVLATVQQLVQALRNSPLPVVAAVHGAAFGAGFSLVLACDLVVATRDARFCMAFAKLGIVADTGAAWLATRALGVQRAKELVLLADEVSGEDAHRMGLVNRLATTHEDMMAQSTELALRLAGLAPMARALNKNLINRSESMSLEGSLSLEQHAMVIAVQQLAARMATKANPGSRSKTE
jgi:2-(1,2-epoxy-1,2-dihydrophenyl)acetyl-CoA isomerase